MPETDKPTQARTYEPVMLGQDVLRLADVKHSAQNKPTQERTYL